MTELDEQFKNPMTNQVEKCPVEKPRNGYPGTYTKAAYVNSMKINMKYT